MKKMILLNGSPRKQKTSYRFSQSIQKEAQDRGLDAEIYHVIDAFRSEEKMEEILIAMHAADYLGLVTPMYVDYLPYPVVWFMEESVKRSLEIKPKATFFAVAQCGFPDVTLLDPVLGACQIYSKKMHREWAGGISYGGGAILDGIPMDELGKRGEAITKAFSMMMEDLVEGRIIRQEVQDLMTVKIPRLLYRPLAGYLNYRSKQMAKANGVQDLWAQPYKR